MWWKEASPLFFSQIVLTDHSVLEMRSYCFYIGWLKSIMITGDDYPARFWSGRYRGVGGLCSVTCSGPPSRSIQNSLTIFGGLTRRGISTLFSMYNFGNTVFGGATSLCGVHGFDAIGHGLVPIVGYHKILGPVSWT